MALRGDDELYSLLASMGTGGAGVHGQAMSQPPEVASAAAAAAAASAKTPSTVGKSLKSDKKTKSKRHKGDKRLKGTTSTTTNQCQEDDHVSPGTEISRLRRMTFADSRMIQNCHVWPCSNDGKRMLSLGTGLLHSCDGYNIKCDRNELYGFSTCHACGKSAATHELGISSSWTSDERSSNPLSFMSVASIAVASRNIRCVIGEYYPQSLAENQGSNWDRILEKGILLPPLISTSSSSKSISNVADLYLGRILSLVKRMKMELLSTSPKPRYNKVQSGDDIVIIDSLASIPIVIDIQQLQETISELTKAVQDYNGAVVASSHDDKKNSTAIDVVESRLAAMASCDFVYYRCYYEVVSSRISTDSAYDGTVVAAILPHPPTYFTCPGFAWDVQNAGVESLRVYMGLCSDKSNLAAPLDESCKQTLLRSWGLEERLSALTPGSDTGSPNPLLTLWQSRFMETIRHVWGTRYSAVKLPIALTQALGVKALSNSTESTQLIFHQAKPLSPELSQWRDSIRDYPAHFYAYAAPTTEAMNAVSNYLRSLDIHQVLEAGAGTGYWSALLLRHVKRCAKPNESSVQVIPYDVAPPSSKVNEIGSCETVARNEYHGHVSSFVDVLEADSFEEALSSTSKSRKSSSAKSALLLCYPPPGSDMAQKALLSHMSNGGHTVIHIGEWQGLTGDESFEALLQQNFYCRETGVVPLPLWGTDATYLTIWKRKGYTDLENENGDESYSSAVGHCSVSECRNHARRRCRYARCIQYCSFDCYEKNRIPRRAMLAIHMIDTRLDGVVYEDDRHFMDLNEPNIHCCRMKRKKRKKNTH